jgi:ABC-type nitrate/sulfonate/bicarbonate transport system permease component
MVSATRSARLVRTRSGTKNREREVLVVARIVLIAVVVGLWQITPKRILPAYAVGRPNTVASSLWHLVSSNEIWPALARTGQAVLYALIIGALIGVALAAIGTLRLGRWLLQPIVTVAYAIPKVALIPIYVIILGIDTRTHVVLVVSMVLFVFYFSMNQALGELDADQLLVLRLMGATRMQVARSFAFPSAIPQLIGATRIALPLAFGIEVFAELRVPTSTGLGVLLANAANTLNAPDAMAVTIVIVVVAYVLDVFIGGRLRRYTESIGMGVPG